MSADGFMYEGRDVTANMLAKEFVWSRARIQSALESGVQTREAMVEYQTQRDRSALIAQQIGGAKGFRKAARKVFGGAR